MLKEEPLNAYLADIIRESHTGEADPEVTVSDGRMDIRCMFGGQTVGIEAKLGYRPAQQRAAISDANRRLVNDQCDVAVALLYPTGEFRTADDLRNGEVRVNIRSKPFPYDDPTELRLQARMARWDTVAVASLSDYLENAPDEAGSPETLASMADVAIESAFDRFTPLERGKILHDMNLSDAKDPDKALKGLLTDLMIAIMFHAKLDVIRHTLDRSSWCPPRVIDCINSPNIQAKLRSAHHQWLEVDYKQILEWSCAILAAMPPTISTRSVLTRIAQVAENIESSSGGQHHDLFGITFCQSVASAKNDGSMYTTIPAATLLTRLALASIEDTIDWTDYEQVTGLRIVDFACGTGTLLIAAANYILSREQTGRHEDVARALLENVLYGFDIYDRAVFQSATGLGMISPSVAFREMHLYSMLLGIDTESGCGRIGSLELLEGLDQGTFNPPPIGTRVDARPAPIEVDSFDIAIMNPPFTVQDKRHQQFSQGVKDALKRREQQLSQGTAIHRSGNSGAFVVLADKHLNDDVGVLAFVLPSATVNAPSAQKLRVWLSERFHIKYLIVSYDPNRIFFSGNTNIGEMLVVASRKRQYETRSTRAVKLIDNPATASSAVAVAQYIVDGTADRYDSALLDEIPYEKMAQGDWRALQFADSSLYHSATDFSSGWECTLGDQFEVKDIGAPVSIHGERLDEEAPGSTPVLWRHDADYCNKFLVEPDAWVKPKPGHEREMRRHSDRLHRLKLPERVRLTSSCATALLTTEPALGMAWQNAIPRRADGVHRSLDIEKVAAVILNSTIGKLTVLLERSNKIPSYPHFSIAAQRSIGMPSIDELTVEQVQTLVDVFDELAEIERKPFPEAHTCEVQIRIDEVVCDVLGFDRLRCEDLRNRLAREPMISNKPYRQRARRVNGAPRQPELAG